MPSFLDRLRSKPEAERKRILWTAVGVSAVVIVIIYFIFYFFFKPDLKEPIFLKNENISLDFLTNTGTPDNTNTAPQNVNAQPVNGESTILPPPSLPK